MPIAKKLPSGSYRAKVYVGKKKDGKPYYKSVTASTKKEAEHLASLYEKRDGENLTVSEAVQRYILVKEATLSSNTIRSYISMASNLDSIGRLPLSSLNSEKLQALISHLMLQGKNPKTVRNIYGLLSATLKMYYPGAKYAVTLPQKLPNHTQVPSDEEVALMIREAPNDDLRLAIQLAAFGSLRRGEVCALMSDCVFKDHIQIRRSCARRSGGEWYIKDSPKTAAGFRDVPLPPEIMEELQKKANEMPRLHKVISYEVSGLFSAYRRLLQKLGLPAYHFHALRHYFATFCHAQGIPDKYIMKIGGWDDVTTLMKIYQHTTPEKMDEVISQINNHFLKVSGSN